MLAARCFWSAALVPFFRAAKVLPVDRGAGMHQRGMAAAEDRLAGGDWVHIFPEGTRSRDGKLGPVRKGIGRLVAACPQPPLIVPFVHQGMEGVMPKGTKVPKVGQSVQVLVGEPIDVSDLLAQGQSLGEEKLYKAIAQRVGVRLHALTAQLEGRAVDEAGLLQSSEAPLASSSLDLFDPADLAAEQQGGASLWEVLKFQSEHRQWGMRRAGSEAQQALEHQNLNPARFARWLMASCSRARQLCADSSRGSSIEVIRKYAALRSSAMADILAL